MTFLSAFALFLPLKRNRFSRSSKRGTFPKTPETYQVIDVRCIERRQPDVRRTRVVPLCREPKIHTPARLRFSVTKFDIGP